MKICMVFYEMQELGGLEEYATNLAVSLQQRGHQVSALTTLWVSPDNQYVIRLNENDIPLVQLPKWLSLAASDWPTKEKMLASVMWLLTPLVYLLGGGLFLARRRPWELSVSSAHNWLRGQLTKRLIGPDRREPLIRLLLNLWRFRWRPDLLHIQGYTSTLLFVIDWAYAKKLPIVYEEHQTPDAQFDWWQGFQQSINKAARVVAVSEKSAQALRDVCGVTQPIVVRHPLLTDPMVSGWRKNGRTPRGDELIQITTVARLNVTKGLTYLLKAIQLVREDYPNISFKVYGDGALRKELIAQAGHLGLDGSSIFPGVFIKREELDLIMAHTDIFVMSSILEGQPLAVVEAMAYGCPIVATTVGGIPEMIQDDVNGLLCEPKDPHCLAKKIITLIEDTELRLSLGRAARESYERGPFQPTAVSEHFVTIYNDALAQSRSSSSS